VRDAFGHPQSAVVFGGTSDIARAIVERLVRAGCTNVVLAGRDAAVLTQAADEAREAGATQVAQVAFDALNVAEASSVVDQCFSAAEGDVDLVLMAVGVLGDQQHDELDARATADVLTATTVWPAAALAASFEKLQHQGQGQVVVLSSVAGVRVRRANYVYGAAKAGLDAYAVGLSEAARGTGVDVYIVRPGFVHTRMTEGLPAAPFSTDKGAVADAVLQGLERGQTIIWAPTPLRYVFTAFRFLPQAVWRRLPG
jgi:decaprenylphospho-beta-D-erythro-pentofuranosid-2-ulose 2-reductase